MKYPVLFILVILLLENLSCKQKTINNIGTNHDWTSLSIDEEDHRTVITIHNQEDTSDIKLNDYGSFFTGYHKPKVDSLRVYLSRAEKDSIFSLVKDIISTPVKPKRACTDFFGDIELTIYYRDFKEPGSYKQSIAYSGVCNWDTLSLKTRQLSAVLARKFKNK